MDQPSLIALITWPDALAFAFFLLAKYTYGPMTRRMAPDSLNPMLDRVRRHWMRALIERDNRLTDANLIGHIIHSASFFASTSMILVAGAAGLLASPERAETILAPVASMPHQVIALKLLIAALVLIEGFFRFTWAVRQLNYMISMIGAVPATPKSETSDALIEAMAEVLTSAIRAFNDGVRGYYFAFAVFAWLLGPWAFGVATAAVVFILIRRQQYSAPASAFRRIVKVLDAR